MVSSPTGHRFLALGLSTAMIMAVWTTKGAALKTLSRPFFGTARGVVRPNLVPIFRPMSRTPCFGRMAGMRLFAEQGGRSSAAVKQQEGAIAEAKSKLVTKKMDLNPPKGTRDFYPEDMRQRAWLFGHWRDVATAFGFEEYDAPVLENEDLYIRKAGEEVTQQLYNFEDKGGRRVSLRPEMTPSLARMVLSKKRGLPLPLKWFSFPQCWRYERMTRGRRREHYQWNMDVWGVEGISAEAELLSAITSFFKNVGLTGEDVGIKVNSRGALKEILTGLGVPEEKFAATCVLVDKLEKLPRQAIEAEMEKLGLSTEVIDRIIDVLQIKDLDEMTKAVGQNSPALSDLRKLFSLAEAYGYADWLVFDASVVRGLSYYTGIVFEGFDRKGEFRAICGGGRYDKLLGTFGGEDLPAVGFGFGDAVIAELLMSKGLMPSFKSANIPVVVSAFDEKLYPVAAEVASKLRAIGQRVDLLLDIKKTKQVLKHTERVSAAYWVNVAPQEWENKQVVFKDLDKRKQSEMTIEQLVERLQGV